MLNRPTALIVFALFLFTACKKNNVKEPDAAAEVALVSATPISKVTAEDMQYRATWIGLSIAKPFINYDSEFFKIVYHTKFKGQTIEASGLIGIPVNGPAAPSIISGQNVTRFLDSSTPSEFPNSTTGYEVLPGMGYITVIPDYIGFGSSKDIVHPYYVREYLASAVVDMIKASKEFLAARKIATSNRLFLVGYSEGGFASLAALRAIETNPSYGLTVTGVAAGSGGFDLPTMMNSLIDDPTYFSSVYMTHLIRSYNTTLDWNRPMSDFIVQPYRDMLPELFDGSLDWTTISTRLPTDVKQILNQDFLTNLRTAGKEVQFKEALTKNSFLDWYPKTPTRLYHGTLDKTVPYESTQTVFDSFKAKGATNVTLTPVIGDHETALDAMMADVLPWLLSLDK